MDTENSVTLLHYKGSGDKLPETFDLDDVYIMGKHAYVACNANWSLMGEITKLEPVYISNETLILPNT